MAGLSMAVQLNMLMVFPCFSPCVSVGNPLAGLQYLGGTRRETATVI
jgi:hypothetical protein